MEVQHLIGQVLTAQGEIRATMLAFKEVVEFRLDGIITRLDTLNGTVGRHGEKLADHDKVFAVMKALEDRDTTASRAARREESTDRREEQQSISGSDSDKTDKRIGLIKWVLALPWIGQSVLIIILVFALQGTLLEVVKRILAKWGM